VELVVRLSGALQRQDLALDEEQGLLEELLATGTDQSSGTPPGPLGSFVSSEDGPGALLLALGEKEWTLLVSYTFERRYGWSESTDSNDDRAMESLDNRAKKKINETLEQVLNLPSVLRSWSRRRHCCAQGSGHGVHLRCNRS
jgi:hypothetical protein